MTDANEVLQEYLYGNNSRDKILKTFYSVFVDMIPSPDHTRCASLAIEIENYIKNHKLGNELIKSKFLNLKNKSNDLCIRIYSGDLTVCHFMQMSLEEMKSSNLKVEESRLIQEGIDRSQIAKSGSESDLFFCFKCKQRKCRYEQLQTRSADEPMTTFVFCQCGNTWKF